MSVWVSAFLYVILPIWHFSPTAVRHRVCLISVGLYVAVEGGVLKGLECEESSQLPSSSTASLSSHTILEVCFCAYVVQSVWGEASVCLYLCNTDCKDLHKRHSSPQKEYIFLFYHGAPDRWCPHGSLQVITPRCCACIYVCNNLPW